MTVIIKTTTPAADWVNYLCASALLTTIAADPREGQLVGQPDPSICAKPSVRLTTAKVNETLAGCVFTKLDSDGMRGWICSLGVHPEFRGMHLASTLIQAAVDDRIQVDGYGLPLSALVRVFDGVNQPSMKAFQRCGFVASAPLRISVLALPNAPHFGMSAASDGSVGLILMSWTGFGMSPDQLNAMKGVF